MISVRGLSKRLNGQEILRDINLEIRPGEILVILGESGSGKTVLLRHLVGLMKPDAGRIEIKDTDITQLPEKRLLAVRKDIGYLFQEGALYDFMTVFDNVAFPLREHTSLKRPEIEERVGRTLAMVGLESAMAKFPAELSGGMKKRAALARAIVLGSKILFCDEPTSGLDPIKSRSIMDLIRDIARQIQSTTVITSHDIANSLRIADRLILIREGKLVAQGTAPELRTSSDPFVREFLG